MHTGCIIYGGLAQEESSRLSNLLEGSNPKLPPLYPTGNFATTMKRETTMLQNPKIQAVFGQFAVSLANGAQLFATEAEAATALASFENGAAYAAKAAAYCADRGIDGKNAVTKTNVIVDFLTYQDSTVETEVETDELGFPVED